MKINPIQSFVAVACLMLCAYTTAGMIDKDGMQEWEICAMCHNYDGISRMSKFPKLAGQKPAYISQQFFDFNEGHRTNDGGQMVAITTEVNLTKVDDIANYFSQLPHPEAEPLEQDATNLALFSQGEKLFHQGADGIPACIGCHGQSESNAPWLYAQHKDYLSKQLSNFRSSDRGIENKSEMLSIASKLSDNDIESVAIYLASTQPRSAKN